MPELRIPRDVNTPPAMASALLTQAAGDRNPVERFAWDRRREAQERNSAPAAEFWLDVVTCVAERTEEPPVATAAVGGRFDAMGKPIRA